MDDSFHSNKLTVLELVALILGELLGPQQLQLQLDAASLTALGVAHGRKVNKRLVKRKHENETRCNGAE
jgi:hypothetical protein